MSTRAAKNPGRLVSVTAQVTAKEKPRAKCPIMKLHREVLGFCVYKIECIIYMYI